MLTVATHRGTITPELGTGWKTLQIKQNILKHILIKATTATTIFDVKIENSFGDVIYAATDVEGEIADEVHIPFARNATLRIENATVNEVHTYTLDVQET